MLTKQEFVAGILEQACEILEETDEEQIEHNLRYFKYEDKKFPTPIKFQPSSGDKMILMNLIEEHIMKESEIKEYMNELNTEAFAKRILYIIYYPLYNPFNKFQEPQ